MLHNRNLSAGDSLLWSDFDPVDLFTGSRRSYYLFLLLFVFYLYG